MVTQISIKNKGRKKRVELGNFFFSKGDVSFYCQEIKEKIDDLDLKGICMRRFAGDIMTRGDLYSKYDKGDRLKIGHAEMVITKIGKPCHAKECNVYDVNGKCLLQEGVMFADVVKEGDVALGDVLELMMKA